ncbi:MAG: rhombotarget lipoprotein [Verrucomicrobia bacterium]|nr:rhombotarget lipoprotein [Verrucomicrobiota bacterium]
MLNQRTSILVAGLLGAGLALSLAGCATWGPGSRKSEKSSSVVDFLYPKQAEPLITPGVPVLRLPLRVGIAFVPPPAGGRGGYGGVEFSEAQKSDLLNRVAAEFRANEFIQSIDVIPTTYLRPGGGFENLDQVRALLGLDVVVLLAFDQVQFTDQNKLSLAYWTIVGAYLFRGNKNDTHTLLEAVVYDIASRKLLFRAPGASNISASSTVVEVRDRLRRDSAVGFNEANKDLIKNLQAELAAFKERVKNAPPEAQVARIEHRPGYKGGGALGPGFAGALALLGLVRWLHRRRQ